VKAHDNLDHNCHDPHQVDPRPCERNMAATLITSIENLWFIVEHNKTMFNMTSLSDVGVSISNNMN
jgi:hypothetical protein